MNGNIINSMSFGDYSRIDAINASKLSYGRKSMLHMKQSIETPFEASKGMLFGTAAHNYILESGDRIVICDADGRSKEGKAARLLANEQAGQDGVVITSEDMAAIKAMREAVMADCTMRRIIESTEHEISAVWSGNYGRAKARFDMLSPRILADYKTTADINLSSFFRTAENMWYHGKMGWYAEGIETITGDLPEFWLIVQENKPPYDCYPCRMSAQTIAQGRKEAVEIAMKWRVAQLTNVYHGVALPDEVIEYKRPAWATFGLEDEMPSEEMKDGEL